MIYVHVYLYIGVKTPRHHRMNGSMGGMVLNLKNLGVVLHCQ